MRKARDASIRKIAEQTGYSASTVSRALNNHPRISAETTAEIHNIARELGYRPQASRKAIALVLPSFDHKLGWYSMNILNVLLPLAAHRGYILECHAADQVENLDERAIAGIISLSFQNQLAKMVGPKFNTPIVCINDFPRHMDGVYSVTSHEFEAIRTAVGYLVGFGHRKVGLLVNGNIDTSCNQTRLKAFEQMRQVFNLDPASKCLYRSLEFMRNRRVIYLHDLVRQFYDDGITAIVCTGEGNSVEVLHSLCYCGLKVPDDMSLITWELPGITQYLPMNLTSMAQNFPAIAEKALDMLENQIHHQTVDKDVLVDYIFHERGSVALARK